MTPITVLARLRPDLVKIKSGFGVQTFTKRRTRKGASCHRCQQPIDRGQMAWRTHPGNEPNRFWRICTTCVGGKAS